MAEELSIQRNPLVRLRDYFSEVRVEMRRVTWPGKQEVYGTTVMVVLTTFFFGFYFWICDLASRNVVQLVMNFLRRRT